MKIKPLAGYVVIEPLEADNKSAGGILLPDNAQEKPTQGKVLAVGGPQVIDDDVVREAEFAVGDVVLYKKWGGDEVKVDGKDVKLVKFEDVMAILEGGSTSLTTKGGK
jgi:chaperonin GroES